MITRVRQMHPFGPEDAKGCYFTPLIVSPAYRFRQEHGQPFSGAEVLAIVEDALRSARYADLNIDGLEVHVYEPRPDRDWFAVDYEVGFSCDAPAAAAELEMAIEKALEPINALWLIESPDHPTFTLRSYRVFRDELETSAG